MIRRMIYFSIGGLLFLSCGQKKAPVNEKTEKMDNELTLVTGTYTSGSHSKGIYTFRFDQETGTATPLSEIEVTNPSYLTLSADNKFVYAVSEQGNGEEAVHAFAFDRDKGTLRLLNSQPAMGADPCYITTNGRYVITANYSGGSVSAFPIQEDGTLLPASDVIAFSGSSVDKRRQDKPHVHCVRFSPDGKRLFATDLGTDLIYKFDVNPEASAKDTAVFIKAGTPSSFNVSPGSGPRHLTFAPNGKYAYLINELSGTVIVFRYTGGQLEEVQAIQADDAGAQGSADIHVSPDGRFLYASNRLQEDGIAIFSINEADGKLTRRGYQLTGAHPRNFILTPNGKYLLVASRDRNAIEVYERNKETGALTNTGKDIAADKPVCLQFAR